MQARATGGLEPYDTSVAQLRAFLDLLMERAERERRQFGMPLAVAPDAAAFVEGGPEAAASPAVPHELSAEEARPGPSSEENESALDRSAWRSW